MTQTPPVYRDEHGEYCLIALTQGQFAKVDAADYDWLTQWKWCAHYHPRRCFYAVRSQLEKGKRTFLSMQRVIVNAPPELELDHEDHDTLNNRRYNLRTATASQNLCNRRAQRNNKCGLKGVHWDKWWNTWKATIYFQKKRKRLGSFKTKEAAFEAYKKAAVELHGQFACF